MKRKLGVTIASVTAILLFALCSTALAQGIKDRFKERVPQIVQLKNEGAVGENNGGYLEFVGDKKKMEDVVDAENKDRRLVYEKIAEKEGATVEKVGRRRAIQIRELAKPGDWLQDDGGKWYQK